MGLGRKIPEVRAIPVPYFQQGLSLLMWPPPPACWWSLSTGKFLPALSTLSSLEGSSLCTAHRWGWGLCALSWRTEYQHQLLGTLRRFVTSSPLTHSLVHSRQCGPLDAQELFRERQEEILLLFVCVQRPQRTEAAAVATGESLASLITVKFSFQPGPWPTTPNFLPQQHYKVLGVAEL